MRATYVVFVMRSNAFSWDFCSVQWRGLEGDAGGLLTGWIDNVGSF